jgi:hypothetical protein
MWYKSERENKKKERNDGGDCPRATSPFPPWAGPTGPIDNNGGMHML